MVFFRVLDVNASDLLCKWYHVPTIFEIGTKISIFSLFAYTGLRTTKSGEQFISSIDMPSLDTNLKKAMIIKTARIEGFTG